MLIGRAFAVRQIHSSFCLNQKIPVVLNTCKEHPKHFCQFTTFGCTRNLRNPDLAGGRAVSQPLRGPSLDWKMLSKRLHRRLMPYHKLGLLNWWSCGVFILLSVHHAEEVRTEISALTSGQGESALLFFSWKLGTLLQTMVIPPAQAYSSLTHCASECWEKVVLKGLISCWNWLWQSLAQGKRILMVQCVFRHWVNPTNDEFHFHSVPEHNGAHSLRKT